MCIFSFFIQSVKISNAVTSVKRMKNKRVCDSRHSFRGCRESSDLEQSLVVSCYKFMLHARRSLASLIVEELMRRLSR